MFALCKAVFAVASSFVSSLRIAARRLIFTKKNCHMKPKEFPCLSSAFKASHVKVLLWYFTEKAVQFAEQNPALRGAALCIWSLSRAVRLLDTSDILLTSECAKEFDSLLTEHLMHNQALNAACKARGVKRYKIRPKHHYLEEMGKFALAFRVNPRWVACFQDESFLGHIKLVATHCHSENVLQRVFERIVMNYSDRWHKSRQHSES